MKYTAFNSVEIVGSVNSNVFHQNVDVKFFQVATSHCIIFMHSCVLKHT